MKYKALRTIAEPYEFVHIDDVENINWCMVSTSDIPRVLPNSVTMEGLIDYYNKHEKLVDFERYELVEVELIEPNTTGADIRNKLSPIKNLLSILRSSKVPLHENPKINEIIQEEIIRAESSIAYIANLL